MINGKITKIGGTAIPLRGDDIDTDRIIPARYLRCVTFDGLGEHAFEDDRQQNQNHPFNQKRFEGASVLIVGKNFGCGSSREHAPQSLAKWGIKVIIGKSFAEIFFANCQAMGIPCMVVSDADGEELFKIIEESPDREWTIDIETATIKSGMQTIPTDIPTGTQLTFLEGTWNATSVLLQADREIDALAKKLPYLNHFLT